MSVGPLDITPVIDRLRTQVTALRLVGGAADAATAQTTTPTTPAAFVLLGEEQAERKTGASGGVIIQAVTATFGVLLALRNVRASERGMAAADSLQSLIAAMREAVIGWKPDPEHSGAELAGGRLQSYDTATLWWLDTYRMTYQLRQMVTL